ncbi:hypothetical protein [Gaoshiqia sediminis]|uniref:Lipoprotein n=1 Tax=Gaoshiqia sediminis TaxID=2986998 RepID=A0AA41Y9H8_9BACT|nr:hypothetical protein [Gaoshiqia sediminis]MCW0484076.1 hypothetical protein [Gaoshiqia sediminis]
MKTIFFLISIIMLTVVGCVQTADNVQQNKEVEYIQTVDAPVLLVQDEIAVDETVITDEEGTAGFLKTYWLELLIAFMAFAKVIVNLTPTTRDNKVFGWLDTILNAITPNYKKGGGTF